MHYAVCCIIDVNVSDYELRFARTAHILQRLTVFAVNTGIWTVIFAGLTTVLVRATHCCEDLS